MEALTDDSLMPFGKYEGQKMATVPDRYLLWIYNNTQRNQQNKTVFAYIEENFNVIETNVQRNRIEND